MAKYKRTVVGSVIKSNSPEKPNYIKFNLKRTNGVLVLKDGQTLSVESKKYQTDSLQKAVTAGKISADLGGKIQERIDKIPDFILGEIIMSEKND